MEITEPTLFGVTLRLKRPMLAACIGGGIGGLIVGLSGAYGTSFVFPSVLTLPVFFNPGFGLMMLGTGVGLALGFVLTLVMGFDEGLVENQ